MAGQLAVQGGPPSPAEVLEEKAQVHGPRKRPMAPRPGLTQQPVTWRLGLSLPFQDMAWDSG